MRTPQHSIAICREGWFYLAVLGFILAGAVARQINLLLILFGMLAGLLLVSWRLVKTTLGKVEIRRALPGWVSAGDLLVVELLAANRRRRRGSWAVAAEDCIRRDGAAEHEAICAAALFAYLAPGKPQAGAYRVRLPRRGRYRFGPLRISTRFPLGLLRYSITHAQSDSLVVFPRLGRLGPRWQQIQQPADVGTSSVPRQQGVLEGEFFGLRDWRPSDSRRWIHWRTSARRRGLVVRQFERRGNEDLAIVVDLWRPAEPDPRHLENVELAVSFAASVVADLCRRGPRRVSVAAAAREPWSTSGPTSTALLREAIEGLALAEADPRDSLPEVLGATFDGLRRGARVIVIGTRPSGPADAQRFAALARDARRRAWLGKVHSIDVSQDGLADYFTLK